MEVDADFYGGRGVLTFFFFKAGGKKGKGAVSAEDCLGADRNGGAYSLPLFSGVGMKGGIEPLS